MTLKKTVSFKWLVSSAALAVVLTGCGSESSDAPEENDAENTETTETETASEETGAEYPLVIEHAFGESVLEEKPERVATVQWGNQDIALALDVVPVGFSAANFGIMDDRGLLPWTAEKVEELGESDPNVYQDTDGLDFEAISDSNPDVILAAYSGITQEDYDLLSQIAPVVAYPTSPWTTTWREQITMNAAGMGMEEEGEKLVEETESLIEETAAEHPEIEGKNVLWVNFSANDLSSLHLYTPVDTRVSFLQELGLVFPEGISEMIENDTDYSLSLSAENADALNEADVIVGYGDDDLLEALQGDSRLGQIPAIERGSVVFIDGNSDLAAAGTPNPLSISYTIDQYVDLIGEAVDKIEE
ncbi:ABC transporter substrate-binding protein [Alkalicoccobacillus murimartini]|uniref:Iron complex transport system substrate-binding protein n=1 Tax=Alkalicoccobacillus murimartini TaxID=171685 RepID=A0ABT9YI75_9BACI|nr:ABC transporter substrate-binding protein [Alkalicoccobacillus murimartini]MDQ0207561.1 iron complex transport system substrate-binding protein [Alkalicoccobacillus murimartini]